MIKKCLICNSEFVAKNSFVKKGDGKFCSRKCYGKWRALYFRGNKNSAWRGGKIEQTCKICGKQFLSDRRFILKGYGFLCSKKCRHKWQSKTYRGKNHIKWLGKTSIATQIRATAQYKEWRQNVFIRDRFTCRKCNDNRGGNLQAHHIRLLSVLIKEAKNLMPLFDIETAIMAYTPIWNISNGITLCEKCHKKTKHVVKNPNL